MKIINDTKGVVAIEFAMLLLPFLIFLMILIEILLLIYKEVSIEYINSMAAKESSTFLKDKKEHYENYIKNRLKDIGFFLKDNYVISLKYCKNFEDLSKNKCGSNEENSQIIVYELKHKIKPILIYNYIDKNKVIISRLAYFNERVKEK